MGVKLKQTQKTLCRSKIWPLADRILGLLTNWETCLDFPQYVIYWDHDQQSQHWRVPAARVSQSYVETRTIWPTFSGVLTWSQQSRGWTAQRHENEMWGHKTHYPVITAFCCKVGRRFSWN